MKANTTHSPINETYELPSNGLLYEGKIPSTITLRCMTTFEEKMRLGSGSFATSMIRILNACILDEDVDAGELTDNDFWFLLYKLRTISYGENYNMSFECPNPDCGKVVDTTINLDDLEVLKLDAKYTEPREIVLPYSKDKLGIRYLRAKEVDELSREAEKITQNSPDYYGDPMYQLEMEHRIATINGEVPSTLDKKNYVANMIGMDSAYFHQKVDEPTHGLLTTVTVHCPFCNSDHQVNVPMTSEFFRPTFRD